MDSKQIKIFLEKIDENFLMNESSSAKYARGYNYFKQGAVKKISLGQGTIIKAEVLGSEQYEVSIELSKSPPVFSCNCLSIPDELCKHCVATGLTILDNPGFVEIIPEIKPSLREDKKIREVLKNTSSSKKDAFLLEIFQKNSDLKEIFLIKTLGQISLVSKKTIKSIRDELIKKIEKLNFSNQEELYYYGSKGTNSSYYGYREDYEYFQDGADYMINNVLNPYKKKVIKNLQTGNIVEANKYYLGILTGVLMIDSEKIEDEQDIFYEEIKSYLLDIAKHIFYEFFKIFKTCDKSEEALKIISENLFSELIYLKENNSYEGELFDLSFLKILILELVQNPELAEYIDLELDKIELCEADKDEIKMKIAEISKKTVKWLEIAHRSYLNNIMIGKQLLNYYQKNCDTESFISYAQKLFENSPKEFSEFLYENRIIKKNKDLYIKILETLARNRSSIIHFRELKKIADIETIESFIKCIGAKYKNKFWVELLVEEKKFETILDHIKKNSSSYEFEIFITPIINIYPEECFNIVKMKTTKFLTKSVGRGYYVSAANWLKILTKIKNRKIRKKLIVYIDSLLFTFKKRSAMKDEFLNAGLMNLN